MLYRPIVLVDHPRTGRREQFEPSEFGIERYTEGDAVDVAYDEERDRFLLVPQRPWRDLLVIPGAGLALIAVQIADWVT